MDVNRKADLSRVPLHITTMFQKVNCCMCTYFSGIHILAELALNQMR